ncbi:Retrovirus-related Pol polyprotein from transposon TNT 1-94 [Senna tora]|uniref:Retrovirus-related Pol polyprotein from transposon TNT 1-94 n=1 Tax=Senna tora TaxID=362788 RepID=A0A834WVZ1_9FABA|nr:Retrovirus-related Pol polyprotein from transposon TNT 1-94 [Senna tora]
MEPSTHEQASGYDQFQEFPAANHDESENEDEHAVRALKNNIVSSAYMRTQKKEIRRQRISLSKSSLRLEGIHTLAIQHQEVESPASSNEEYPVDQVVEKFPPSAASAYGYKPLYNTAMPYFPFPYNLWSIHHPVSLDAQIGSALFSFLQLYGNTWQSQEIGKYLGANIVHGRNTRQNFSHIERIQTRLAGWKANCLSLAGRATLVQTVISTMPYYHMQNNVITKGIIQEIEKIERGFLWGSTSEKRKLHQVSWSKVCKPRSLGGLGIPKLDATNKAFLFKLDWQLLYNYDSLWVKTKLKVHKIPLPDDYVIYAALYSLPPEFSPIKTAYNTQDEAWSINSLISKCVAEEEKLKKEKSESAYLVSRSKFHSKKGKENSKNSNALAAKKDETFKKSGNKNNTGDGGGPKGNSSNLNCYFCKRKGHKKVGNGADVAVQFVGKVVLNLDSGFQLVLRDTFYIPSFTRNLVSISALDKAGYCFNFGNNKVDIFYNSKMIGECILSDGLYKLCSSSKNECLHVENTSAKRSNTKEQSFLLWHKRLGHIKDQVLPSLDYSDMETCIDCAKGKLTKTGKKSATHSEGFLELGFRFYSPTRGTRIVEALTVKHLELDVTESSCPQPPEMPESSTSVSIPLPSLTEVFPPVTVREETMTLPALEGDPGMPVPEIPQHHDPVPDIPQGHDPVPEISQVHEPVQEIPLRRSHRERRPAISTDYHVYLGEADYDIGHAVDPATIKEALHSPQIPELREEHWKEKICDYTDDLFQWDVTKLNRVLPAHITSKIVKFNPPIPNFGQDLPIWNPDSDEVLTLENEPWWTPNIQQIGFLEWLKSYLPRFFGNGETGASKTDFITPNDPAIVILNQAKIHNQALKLQELGNRTYTRSHPSAWMKPNPKWVKLNTDGAMIRESRKASCGRLLRDHDGRWVKGFIMHLGESTLVGAELWGMLKGLEMAWELGIRKLILESDSKKAFESITGSSSHSTSRRIKDLLKRNWKVDMVLIPRAINGCADKLGKKGAST